MNLPILSLECLLEDKKRCLREMLVLTKAQMSAIEKEEIELLESLIDEKSTLISQIDKLDYEFKDSIGDCVIKDFTLLNLLSEIKEILKDIKELDDENSVKMSLAIDEMKANLKGVRQGKRAMKNYGNSDPYQSFVSQGGTLFINQDS